jgi:hypothetical protein
MGSALTKRWVGNIVALLLGVASGIAAKKICDFYIVTAAVIGAGVFNATRFTFNYIIFPEDKELRNAIIRKLIDYFLLFLFLVIFTLLHADSYEERKLKSELRMKMLLNEQEPESKKTENGTEEKEVDFEELLKEIESIEIK